MKIKVTRIEPKEQMSASGKRKYYVYTEDGDRHIAWGDWVEDTKGKEVDVTMKEESFKGNDYTVIWPAKETPAAAPVASDIAVRERTRILAEPEVTARDLPTPSAGKERMSQSYWERRDRMMAKESALKSAAEVWSSKLTINPTEGAKTDPLSMAKEFYRWITQDGE